MRDLLRRWRQPTLHRRCETMLRTLILPEPFSAEAFCATLATQRDRPILIVPTDSQHFESGVHGCVLRFPDADIIFVDQATSPLHREHTTVHEAAHLAWDHRPVQAASPALLALVFPHLSVEALHGVLQRTTYADSPAEQEAEWLALLIMRRAKHRRAGTPSPAPAACGSHAAAVLQRLRAFYEGRED